MKATVWGVATRIGDIAAIRTRSGRIADAHSYDDLALELPADGVPFDLDHDPETRCGQLIYGELADDGRLSVVAVLDNDWIGQVPEDVFWSPTLLMAGNVNKPVYIAREARLRSLALTFNPATLGAVPVRWRLGDVRDPADRSTWPFTWRSAEPLLARALDYNGTDWRSRDRTATHIVDLRYRDNGYPGLRDGARVRTGEFVSRELPNGLRKSAHPGRILRVS